MVQLVKCSTCKCEDVSELQYPCGRLDMMKHRFVISAQGQHRQEENQSSLANQPSLVSKIHLPVRDPVSKSQSSQGMTCQSLKIVSDPHHLHLLSYGSNQSHDTLLHMKVQVHTRKEGRTWVLGICHQQTYFRMVYNIVDACRTHLPAHPETSAPQVES